jgi:hypothetical protein
MTSEFVNVEALLLVLEIVGVPESEDWSEEDNPWLSIMIMARESTSHTGGNIENVAL